MAGPALTGKEGLFNVEEESEVVSYLSRSSSELATIEHKGGNKIRFCCYSDIPHFPSDFSKAGAQGRADKAEQGGY